MKLRQAVPVLILVLLFGSTLTSLSFSVKLIVVGLMVSAILFTVFLKRKEDREKPASTS